MLRSMVARRNPSRPRPDRIARLYAEVNRDTALTRAHSLRREKDVAGARAAAREAARWDRQAQELLRREQLAQAEEQRAHFARLGIERVEAGDIPGARNAAKEAERWDRLAKKLGSA